MLVQQTSVLCLWTSKHSLKITKVSHLEGLFSSERNPGLWFVCTASQRTPVQTWWRVMSETERQKERCRERLPDTSAWSHLRQLKRVFEKGNDFRNKGEVFSRDVLFTWCDVYMSLTVKCMTNCVLEEYLGFCSKGKHRCQQNANYEALCWKTFGSNFQTPSDKMMM